MAMVDRSQQNAPVSAADLDRMVGPDPHRPGPARWRLLTESVPVWAIIGQIGAEGGTTEPDAISDVVIADVAKGYDVSIDAVRAARARGVAVTAEVTPHHFTLTHAECASYDPVFKVNPPLRTDADVAAVRTGLADGVVDAIATDHAPHTQEAKEQAFDEAPPGMLGLETALALALTELDLPVATILGMLSWRPAAIVGLGDTHGGPIAVGRPSNLCVIDPEAAWVVEPSALASRSRNTPYAGRKLTGRVRHTILRGEPVVVDAEAVRA